MDPSLFERVLRHVVKSYHVVSAEEQFASDMRDSSRPPLIITFDDGYKDFTEYALPLLRKYSCPATMFIVTDCIESGFPTWTYVLDHYFQHTRKSSLYLPEFSQGRQPTQSVWNSSQEKLAFAKQLKQSLKRVVPEEREKIMASVLDQLDDVKLPANLMMSWSDVREAMSAGIEIGSHTRSHPALALVTDDQELWNEIFGSGEVIRKNTGKFPPSISYPGGSYDRRVEEFARRAGYKRGYAVNPNSSDERDSFAIPRLELYNESYLKTRLRVNGTIPLVKSLLRK